jgi:hypothetical protein
MLVQAAEFPAALWLILRSRAIACQFHGARKEPSLFQRVRKVAVHLTPLAKQHCYSLFI